MPRAQPPTYYVDQVGRAFVVRSAATRRIVGRSTRLAAAIAQATKHAADNRDQEQQP